MTAETSDQPVWTRKHLLALSDLSRDEILHVLNTADGFQEVSTRSVKKVPALRGRVVDPVSGVRPDHCPRRLNRKRI